MKMITGIAAAAFCAVTLASASAQPAGRGPGQGPVITQCKADLAKYCAGKAHDGTARACLEANKAKVSAACKTALDTTGGGRGRKK